MYMYIKTGFKAANSISQSKGNPSYILNLKQQIIIIFSLFVVLKFKLQRAMDNSCSKSSPMENVGESSFSSESLYFLLESF